MSKQPMATANQGSVNYVHRGMGGVVLRRFDPAYVSFEGLTLRPHRSFARDDES